MCVNVCVYFRPPGPGPSSKTCQHVWHRRDSVCGLPGKRMCCSRKEPRAVQVCYCTSIPQTVDHSIYCSYDMMLCTQERTKPGLLWEMDDNQPLWSATYWRVHLSTNPTSERTVTIALAGSGTWVIPIKNTSHNTCSHLNMLSEGASGTSPIQVLCYFWDTTENTSR